MEIEKLDWYQELINDLTATKTEAEFTSRWSLIEGYHELGKRIIAERDNFEHSLIYGQEIVKRVAISLNTNPRTVYYAVQFARKYPKLDELPGGKSASWRQVIKQLPEPKEVVKLGKEENNEIELRLTGKEWYNRFVDELGRFKADGLEVLTVMEVVQAVKRASGVLEDEK